MEDDFIRQQELGRFVDKLIEKKSPGQPVANEVKIRAIQDLDERITNAVLGDLNTEQLQELDALVNSDGSESTIQAFFDNAGIDTKQKIAEAMETFSAEFLGGENA